MLYYGYDLTEQTKNTTVNNSKTHFIYLIGAFLTVWAFIFATMSILSESSKAALAQVQIEKMSDDVSQYAQSVRLQFEITKGSLQSLARTDEVVNGSTQECNNALRNEFQSRITIFDTISRTNKDGIFDCSTKDSIVGIVGLGNLPYLKTIFEDPKHEYVVSGVSKLNGGRSFKAIHVPIYRNGTFVGTLGSAIYLDELGVESLDTSRGFERAEVVIASSKGELVYESGIGESTAVPTIEDSNRLDYRGKQLVKEAMASDADVSFTEKMGDTNYVIDSFSVDKEKKWIILVKVSENQLLSGVGMNTIGLRIIRADSASHIFASFVVSIIASMLLALIVTPVVKKAARA